MPPRRIYSYLVPPTKGQEERPNISGAAIPLTGKLFAALDKVYERSEAECDIPIAFKPDDNTQTNEVHELIVEFTRSPTEPRGNTLARRLSQHTTSKSGPGLLFLMTGLVNRHHKLVVSRFPAEEGILAEARGRELELEFIEKVFLKRTTTYKAALYSGTSFDDHFWDGSAVDKQIGERQDQLANYWIHGFLASDFRTTPAAGSRRLALALKQAIDDAAASQAVKQELIAASTLARGHAGQSVSIQDFMTRFQLSPEAQAAVLGQLQNRAVADERFLLDREEFDRQLKIHSIELDTGVSVMGPAHRFNEHVRRERVNGQDGEYELRTRGRIVAERLKKSS